MDRRGKVRLFAAVLLGLFFWDWSAIAGVIYVDDDAAAGGDGTSWTLAYDDLQDALADATGEPAELWVAEGVYRPAGVNGDKKATFQLISGAALYGGFVGNETRRDQRDPVLHETVLSGDLNTNDTPTGGNLTDNSFHVVTGSGTDGTAVLDGFTVTAGHALGTGADLNGAGVYLSGGSPTLRQCLVTVNRCGATSGATCPGHGGGIYCAAGSNPLLIDCTISDNDAGDADGNCAGGSGGGVYCTSSSPTLIRCLVSGNTAGNGGGDTNKSGGHGGGFYGASSSAVILNCTFTENTSGKGGDGIRGSAGTGGHGGGLYFSSSSPLVVNGLILGNETARGGVAIDDEGNSGNGGGVYASASAVSLINCTMVGNETARPLVPAWASPGSGGGLYSTGTAPKVTNCIIWDNLGTGTGTTQADQIAGSTPDIDYTCVQGWTGSFGGIGNSGDDPAFDLPHYPRLSANSPYIDAADNTALPADTKDIDADGDLAEALPLDLDGSARFVDDPATTDSGVGVPPLADFGAYEYFADCNGNGIIDSVDILTGDSVDCDDNGTPDECDIAAGTWVDSDGNGVPDQCQTPVLYVDEDAGGAGGGLDWGNAFVALQDAVWASEHSGGSVQQIWVAEGVYPAGEGQEQMPGEPLSSYRMLAGLSVYGGFNGTEISLEERDWTANLTVLSGAGDHVVTVDIDGDAALDGFAVIGGLTDHDPDDNGAGFYIVGGSFEIRNCTISGNTTASGNEENEDGGDGAGVYCGNAVLSLTHCVVRNNGTGKGGDGTLKGGISATGGDGGRGGGIFSQNCVLTLSDCSIFDNSTGDGGTGFGLNTGFGGSGGSGGAVYLIGGTVAAIHNCVLRGNATGNGGDWDGVNGAGGAGGHGGGLMLTASSAEIVNCVINGNTTGVAPDTTTNVSGAGGGVYVNGDASIVNCTVYGHVIPGEGGGIYVKAGNAVVANTLVWHNDDGGADLEAAQLFIAGGAPLIGYSGIEGCADFCADPADGNIGLDPQFVDPDGADGVPTTEDDDFTLQLTSPCLDAGDNTSVPSDVLDFDGDGNVIEPVSLDLGGRPRFGEVPSAPNSGNSPDGGPLVDMGAYEYPGDCNLNGVPDESDISTGESLDVNTNGVPDECELVCFGDANSDGIVDPLDSGYVLSRFGCPVGAGDPACDAADQNGDGIVDPLDAGFILARFGPCP